jgi:hypothetical protein
MSLTAPVFPSLSTSDYQSLAVTQTPSATRRGTLLFSAALALYALFLLALFAPGICMPDDNGYFAQASLIVRQHSTYFVPESNAQYIGMHWLVTPDGKYVSRYPAGLSVFIAAIYATLGWKAAVATNPLLALGALAGLFGFVRRLTAYTGHGALWGTLAAFLVGLNPTFISHTLAGDAHIGVACMLAWAMYALYRWHEEGKLVHAILAGVCIGIIPTIRYPDVVMYLGLGAFALYSVAQKGPKAFLQLLAMAGAAILALLPQLIRNQLVLGAFWRTGYALTNEQTGFGWNYFTNNFWLYIRTLASSGVGPMLALSLAGMAALLTHKRTRPTGLMLLGICLPMLLLYMAYYWSGGPGGGGGGGGGGRGGPGGPGGGGGGGGGGIQGAGIMRFLVPTFLAYSAAGVVALAMLVQQLPSAARIAIPVVLVVMQAMWALPDALPQSLRVKGQRANLAAVTSELERTIEPGSVVVASNGLLQHLDYVRDWKLADASLLRGGMGGRGGGPGGLFGTRFGFGGGGGGDQPSPMQAAKRTLQAQKYTGSTAARLEQFHSDVNKWAADKKVYLVGSESELQTYGQPNTDYQIIARVTLPSEGGLGMAGPGGGPGGGPNTMPLPPGGPDGMSGPGGPPDNLLAGPDGNPDGGFRRNSQRRTFGGGGGGGGGLMNAGSFDGASEVLIAEWVRK